MFPDRKLSYESGAEAEVLSKRLWEDNAKGRVDDGNVDFTVDDATARGFLHLVLSVRGELPALRSWQLDFLREVLSIAKSQLMIRRQTKKTESQRINTLRNLNRKLEEAEAQRE